MRAFAALLGAYHPESRPLDQKRLVVDLSLDARSRARTFRVSALVHAEDIAEGCRATADVTVRFPVVCYRFEFLGDEGGVYVLELAQRLERWTARTLTELQGSLARADGTVVGPARLRFDWRWGSR